MEGSLYWGDHVVLFGWIINMAFYGGSGEQVEPWLQEMGAWSKSRESS